MLLASFHLMVRHRVERPDRQLASILIEHVVRGQQSSLLASSYFLDARQGVGRHLEDATVCSWGSIDVLTPLLAGAVRQGVDAPIWDELTRRYDEAVRERRRTEAVLTAHGANAPNQRTTGLYATGGCSDSVRQRIERNGAVLKAE